MSEPRPPSAPLNRVFVNGVEEKPRAHDGIRLVSNGREFGIQHRKRFLWWTWWRTIHTGLTLDVARDHVQRVREEIRELRAKANQKWYPVTFDGNPLPLWCDSDEYHSRGYPPIHGQLPPPPQPPPWRDSGRRKGEPR